jgi:hypothetical protein
MGVGRPSKNISHVHVVRHTHKTQAVWVLCVLKLPKSGDVAEANFLSTKFQLGQLINNLICSDSNWACLLYHEAIEMTKMT